MIPGNMNIYYKHTHIQTPDMHQSFICFHLNFVQHAEDVVGFSVRQTLLFLCCMPTFLSHLTIRPFSQTFAREPSGSFRESHPLLTRAPLLCSTQREHCGTAPNHVQTPAPAALQHHPLLPPHLPHLGAALCLVRGLVQAARPAQVGVDIGWPLE